MIDWGIDDTTSQDVGASLRQWRLILGLTQAMVAARANISRQTLARLERGDDNIATGTLFAVINVLGLTRRLTDAVEPLNTDLGRARAHLLGRERAPKRKAPPSSVNDLATSGLSQPWVNPQLRQTRGNP